MTAAHRSFNHDIDDQKMEDVTPETQEKHTSFSIHIDQITDLYSLQRAHQLEFDELQNACRLFLGIPYSL